MGSTRKMLISARKCNTNFYTTMKDKHILFIFIHLLPHHQYEYLEQNIQREGALKSDRYTS